MNEDNLKTSRMVWICGFLAMILAYLFLVILIELLFAGLSYQTLDKFGSTLSIFFKIGNVLTLLSGIAAFAGLIWYAVRLKKERQNDNGTSIGRYLVIGIGSLILFFIVISFLGIFYNITLISSLRYILSGYYDTSLLSIIVLGFLPFLLAVFLLSNIIFYFMLIVKLWAAIDDGKSFTTAGKAGILLFVPIFGLIWSVIIWVKYPGQYNKYLERNNLPVKPISSALFITFGILFIIPFIGFINIFLLPLLLDKGLRAVSNISIAGNKRKVSEEITGIQGQNVFKQDLDFGNSSQVPSMN